MTEWTDRSWIHSVTDTVKLFFAVTAGAVDCGNPLPTFQDTRR